jgi:hypothetical protein
MHALINDIRVGLSRLAFPSWGGKGSGRELGDGYTVLLPVPADLPVFARLALEILSRQDLSGLKEVIVIPDWPCGEFKKYLETILPSTPDLPVRVVDIFPRDKLAWALTKSISTRHFCQLIRGVEATKTRHALIHDADLFLPAGSFLSEQYATCQRRDLDVYGLDIRRSQVRSDREVFVATWEMTFAVSWFRSFPPYMHKGHVRNINGRRQEFDTTLLPQYLTPKERIDWQDRGGEYVHFGYVVASYRNFLNGKKHHPGLALKLFLIRVLIDVFEDSTWRYKGLPTHEEFCSRHGLVAGLVKELREGSRAHPLICEFRDKIDAIARMSILGPVRSVQIKARSDEFLRSFCSEAELSELGQNS